MGGTSRSSAVTPRRHRAKLLRLSAAAVAGVALLSASADTGLGGSSSSSSGHQVIGLQSLSPAAFVLGGSAPRKTARRTLRRSQADAVASLPDDDRYLVEEATPETASHIVQRWLDFLRNRMRRKADVVSMADHAGYPLEEALELLTSKVRKGLTVLTSRLPAGGPKAPSALGGVAAVAVVRKGEDLDLILNGGDEWETMHLDFLATNPAVTKADMQGVTHGFALLKRLMMSAQKAGRALTVTPLDERLKERYRQLGFQEDPFVDPSLMFWLPEEAKFAYAM